MPVTITCKDFSPLCKDYEFIVNDIDQLADLIARLIVGYYRHVSKIIRGLATRYPNTDNPTIKASLDRLDLTGKDSKYIEKVHGWLFQMISWIVLAEMHKKDPYFYQNFPHQQPAMHGLDGIAINLKVDGTIDRIIITEDKCTNNDRNTVLQQVFPEFKDIEAGNYNNAIRQHIEALIKDESVVDNIQNDILELKYRQYRIAITRQNSHDTDDARKNLFADYDTFVGGTDVNRRTASTINMNKMRVWMEDLRKKVIAKIRNL